MLDCEAEEPAPLLLRVSIDGYFRGFLRFSLGLASGSDFQPGFSCHSKLKSAHSGFSARISFNFFSRRQPLISFSRSLALTARAYSSYHTRVS
jgi:hypothetical protein